MTSRPFVVACGPAMPKGCPGSPLLSMLLAGLLSLLPWGAGPFAAQPQVRIGVLAKRGVAQGLAMWGPTADYLTAAVPDYRFRVVPLGFGEVRPAAERHEVELVLANPALYVALESALGASRIATLRNLRQGRPYTRFGGVVFTRAGRDDIAGLGDLAGRRLAAVEEDSLGGFLMVWRELAEAGLDPYRDLAELRFEGTHDAVVRAVLEGRADAGCVRTDTLERMAEEGKLDLNRVEVLNQQALGQYTRFPFRLSTRLYPEWPMAALAHTDPELARAVARALLAMPDDSAAARAGHNAGWTVPHNYQPVHDLLRELHLGPYAGLQRLTLGQLLRVYWHWLLAALVALGVLVGLQSCLVRVTRRLSAAQRALERSRARLEVKVSERTAELEEANAGLAAEVARRERSEQELRHANEVAQALFNASPIAICGVDREARVFMWNLAAERLFGWSAAEVMGEPVPFLPPGEEGVFAAVLKSELAGQYEQGREARRWRKDGSCLDVALWSAPLHDAEGQVMGIMGLYVNIGARKAAEEEVRRLNAELEDRVLRRTADLESTNRELEAFAYSVSHDLRAPLRAIDGFSMSLLEDCAARLDAAGREYLERIRANAQRMGLLIDDLLALSRVTRAELIHRPVDLSAMARELAGALLEAQPGREVEWVIADGLEVLGDPNLLRVALQNLLDNALKYTAPRRRSRIEVGAAEAEGERTYYVRDNGVGFDMAHAHHLFGVFQRLHAAQEFAGTGIGLATVQRVVQRHGGRVWARGEPDRGATFYFTLPPVPRAEAREMV